VRGALEEDVGEGDITTQTIVPAGARGRGLIRQKQAGVIYGLRLVEETFAQLDDAARCERLAEDGRWGDAGGPVIAVNASTRALLTGERTALNFLSHLSGIATAAARASRAVEGMHARVLDTRKTTPGLRALEKAAVRAGGAVNHRAGLYDAILIKDNHIAAAGGITQAIEKARAGAPDLAGSLEVEVSGPEQIAEALAAGAPRLLLDNMDDDELRAAVAQVGGQAMLEASGGVTLERLRALAETGVDWISMGAMTHSAPALDLSMTLEPLP
jgi:nicotinate-nucleotide pyrophosphorylase (carboxylating)